MIKVIIGHSPGAKGTYEEELKERIRRGAPAPNRRNINDASTRMPLLVNLTSNWPNNVVYD